MLNHSDSHTSHISSPPSGGDARPVCRNNSEGRGRGGHSPPAKACPSTGGAESSKREGVSPPLSHNLDFPWCLSFFEKRGKEMFGNQFKIHDHDHNIIYKLLIYFLRDEQEANRLGLDLHKGLLLTGPIGCGKTSLMSLMRFVPPPERNHNIKSCRDVSFEFIQEGYQVIWRYSRMSFTNQQPKTYCFDDLGSEQSLKYYGNECNVMGEILLSRYEYYVSHDMITHVTTNLSASEIENFLGPRVRSRMREMFNQITFSNQAKDKRK